MERIREELICAVCLDFLREPKVLHCAHSFCSRCLREMFEGGKRAQGVTTGQQARRSLDLECPSCRHVTVLEHGRVDIDLSTNVNLKRLVDIVSDEEKGRTLKVFRLFLCTSLVFHCCSLDRYNNVSMAGTYIVCFCCAQKMCLLAKIAVITTHSLVCILDIYIMLVCACIPASRRNTRFLPVTNHWSAYLHRRN